MALFETPALFALSHQSKHLCAAMDGAAAAFDFPLNEKSRKASIALSVRRRRSSSSGNDENENGEEDDEEDEDEARVAHVRQVVGLVSRFLPVLVALSEQLATQFGDNAGGGSGGYNSSSSSSSSRYGGNYSSSSSSGAIGGQIFLSPPQRSSPWSNGGRMRRGSGVMGRRDSHDGSPFVTNAKTAHGQSPAAVLRSAKRRSMVSTVLV